MGNVRKWTAMDDSRRMFQRLDEVRFDGVLHEHGHSPFAAQLMNVDRVPIKVRANDNTAKAFLQVFNIIGQARIAMISEATVIMNPSSRTKPQGLPPRPTTT